MSPLLPASLLFGVILCLCGLPSLAQTSSTLDSDGDELPDANDPHPFLAEPPLSWRIGPMKIGWKADDRSIETMTTLNEQEKTMLKKKEYSFDRKVEAGAELNTEVNAALSFNPLKLARSGAEVSFRSRIAASGGFAWNDSEQQHASDLQRIVNQEQVSRLLSDMHIEFTVHFSNYGTEDYLCEDLLIPLKVGEHVTTSAQPLGADSRPFLNHSFRIPANRDKPLPILFRAYLDTQETRKLLQLVQSGTLTVSLSESPGFIRATKDGRMLDAIAAQTAIRRKTCEITVVLDGSEYIYHTARRNEKTDRALSVEDAFMALNDLSSGKEKLFHLTGKSLLSAFGQNNEANPPRWWVISAGRNDALDQDQDVDLALPLPESLHLRHRIGFPGDLSRWLERADEVDTGAIRIAARLHYTGLGKVPVDRAKAVDLWQKAAVRSGAKDVKKAVELWRQAADIEVVRFASKDSPFVNSLGMRFVPVPGTKVLFCVHETRNADYDAFARARSGVDEEWKNEHSTVKEQHPVTRVSWEDGNDFCRWLSAQEGRTYRLPTDAEWSLGVGGLEAENASASPQSKDGKIEEAYPWGGAYPPGEKDGNYSVSDVNDGYERTAPVMQFKVNGHGLYDMGGNVWEWCGDAYSPGSSGRVLRGASWVNGMESYLRSSFRFSVGPRARDVFGGFRCVLVVAGG